MEDRKTSQPMSFVLHTCGVYAHYGYTLLPHPKQNFHRTSRVRTIQAPTEGGTIEDYNMRLHFIYPSANFWPPHINFTPVDFGRGERAKIAVHFWHSPSSPLIIPGRHSLNKRRCRKVTIANSFPGNFASCSTESTSLSWATVHRGKRKCGRRDAFRRFI